MAGAAYTPLAHSWPQDEGPEQGGSKHALLPCDRKLSTRNICVCALIVSFIAGGALTGLGVYIIHFTGPTIRFPDFRGNGEKFLLEFYFPFWTTEIHTAFRALEAIKLFANIALTFLIESLGYIHTASLRWTLLRQGQLSFNSNLRLCSATRGFGPNAWYANIIFTAATVLAYGGASLFFAILPDDKWGTLSLCVVPGTFLGVSILVMTLIALWSLLAARIPTWSSSPLHTVLAAMAEGYIERQADRCMLGVQDINKASVPAHPKKKQIGALASRRAAVCIVVALVLVDACLYVVSAVLLHKWLNETTHISGFGSLPPDHGWDGQPMMIIIPDSLQSAHIYIATLLYAALLWPITLCLHSLELVVNLLRDENCWRTATHAKGCRLEAYDSITAAFTNWRSVTLFAFKAGIHWLFGLTAIGYQPGSSDEAISSAPNVLLSWRPWQSIVLAGVVNLCIIFFLFVGLYQPKGPQPMAYGHLQTLANLVDEWSSPNLYWGHKRDGSPHHAGTSLEPLKDIRMDALYA